MTHIVTAPLVILKIQDGTRVHLYQGTPVPDTADKEHVKQLLADKMIDKAPTSTSGDTRESSVKEILTEVGDDPAKASAALETEQAKGDKARATLVEKLTAIANPSA